MRHFLILAMLLVGACAAKTPAPKVDANLDAATLPRLGQDEILSRLSALPGQQLAAGECGLFLWLKRDDAPLVLFQRSKSDEARMIIDGKVTALKRTSLDGPIGLSFFEKQDFTAGDMTFSLRIQAERDKNLQQGLKVPAGILSMASADGWSAALPVAGAIGCQ